MKLHHILIIMISLFSSCKGQNRNVPEWANFFDKKEYNCFIDIVEEYFKQKNFKISINDGVVTVENNDLGLNNLGLVNLAQICKQEKRNVWKEIVIDHFNRLIEANKFEADFNSKINDFEQIKQYIGVRLYHKDYLKTVGKENTVYKELTDEIVELRVFDLPHTVSSIKPENISTWNKKTDELFDLGFKNIKSNYPLEISQQDMKDYKIWFVQSDNVFASNILLDRDDLNRYLGKYGALIGIPHRHAVIIYPIENLEVAKAINSLIPIIKGMNNEGPGSISDKLYWYNDNKLINLPYKIAGNKLQFYPPDDFVNMLNKLKD
jgi:hypothetical protein